MKLTLHKDSAPQIMKWGKSDWRVIIPTGKDILGNHHFQTKSIHKSKQSALKAMYALVTK